MTLLFPLMWSVILTQSWTDLEINPILEITVLLGKTGSGHFQRQIWKLAAVIYEDMLAIDKIGIGSRIRTMTGSGLWTSVSACIKAPKLLLFCHV